jgi:cysteine desulfurase/selenocysteine lyase
MPASEGQDRPLTADGVARIRREFPILGTPCRDKRLIYLDNAATSQKPQPVIDAVTRYYSQQNANVHRGVHYLSELATQEFEEARLRVQRLLGARLASEIVFTRGATESINLVAQTFGRQRVRAGGEILVSVMEHHSNIVPWQLLCEEKGAVLRVIPMTDEGELEIDAFARLLNERTRLVAITHVSNVLGTVNPIKSIIDVAHAAGVPVLIDGAQSAPHLRIDVEDLGCDFFVCSGHKMFGPTGIGVLYGRAEHLEAMPPWQGGGGMIRSVSFEGTTYAAPPAKFEAGTPNIAGAVGLAAAIDYVEGIGMEWIAAYESELIAHASAVIGGISGVRILGRARNKIAVVSFAMDCAHPHDVAQILDDEGIAIRAGHHCAQPLMARLGVAATARASLAFYNTRDEIDALGRGLEKVKEVFG